MVTPSFFSWFYMKYPFWVVVGVLFGVIETLGECAFFIGATAFLDFVGVPFVMNRLEE